MNNKAIKHSTQKIFKRVIVSCKYLQGKLELCLLSSFMKPECLVANYQKYRGLRYGFS